MWGKELKFSSDGGDFCSKNANEAKVARLAGVWSHAVGCVGAFGGNKA
jgi:hypothetical protein